MGYDRASELGICIELKRVTELKCEVGSMRKIRLKRDIWLKEQNWVGGKH